MARLGIHLQEFEAQAAFTREDGLPVDVTPRDGETLYGTAFPSFVFFDANGEVRSVGLHAKYEWALNPGLVVWGVKRFIGMPYNEAFKAEDGFSSFGYRDRVERTGSDGIAIRFGSKTYTPEDVLAIMLRRIKEDAENVQLNPLLGGKVDGAVIAVPAYFDPTRVGPILQAAELAGFGKAEVAVTEIAEPTAAMLSYVNANRDALPRGGRGLHVLTFDIGAGTTDVVLNRFDIVDGELLATEVSIEGDNHVGGINMDSALLDFLKHKYASTGLAGDETAQAKLLPRIEQARTELTEYPEMDKASLLTLVGGKPTRFELSRDELVAAMTPVWDGAVLPLHELFRESKRRANVVPDRVDIVLFGGGPSRLPWLRQRVRRELAALGLRPEVLAQIDRIDTEGFPPGCDPIRAVAHGAALMKSYPTKLNPYGFGVIVADRYYVPILEDNQPYPTRQKSVRIPVLTSDTVSVRFARKTRVSDPGTGGASRAEYVELGAVDFATPWRSKLGEVEVSMRCTENRQLVVTVSDPQTGFSEVAEHLEGHAGAEMKLQEMSTEAIRALAAKPAVLFRDELERAHRAQEESRAAAEAKRIVEADQQGRFFEALGLESNASVDDIRTRQVELAFRMRSIPDAAAAVNHAAEMAVDLLRTPPVSVPAVIDRLLLEWRPAWGVPSEDLPVFLRAHLNLERMVSDITGDVCQRGMTTEQGVLGACLAFLSSHERQFKHEMAMWYLLRAAGLRSRAISEFNTSSRGASPGRARELAYALGASLRTAAASVKHARTLEPAHPEVLAATSRLNDDMVKADRTVASCFPPASQAPKSPSHIAAEPARAQRRPWMPWTITAAVVAGVVLSIVTINRRLVQTASRQADVPTQDYGASTQPPPAPPAVPPAARVSTPPAAAEDHPEVPLPPNGSVRRFHSSEAIAPFEVQTGPGSYNYYVKMIDRSTRQTAVTIFIRAGRSVHVEMPIGNYDMRYAVGTRWYGREHLFGAHTQYYKADAVIDFRIEGNQVAGHRVELILQEGGNLKTDQIPASSW